MGKPKADPHARGTGLPLFLLCLTGGLIGARVMQHPSLQVWLLLVLLGLLIFFRHQVQPHLNNKIFPWGLSLNSFLVALLAFNLGLARGAQQVKPPPVLPGQVQTLQGLVKNTAMDDFRLFTENGWSYPLSWSKDLARPEPGSKSRLKVRVSARQYWPTGQRDNRPLGFWARKQGPWLKVLEIQESAPPPFNLSSFQDRLRRQLAFRLLQEKQHPKTPPTESMLSPSTRGLLGALILGQRQNLSADIKGHFQRAGVSHLLALSGLHALLWLGLLALLCQLFPRPIRLPVQLFGLGLFLLMVDVRSSLWRAGFLALFFLLGNRFGYRPRPITLLFWAAAVELCLWPSHSFDLGFQMSYLACLAITLLFEPLQCSLLLKPFPPWLRVSLATGVAASLGVLPLSLAHFQGAHPGSTITTLFALPFLLFTFLAAFWHLLALPGSQEFVEAACDSLLQAVSLGAGSAPDWAFQAHPPTWLLWLWPLVLIFWWRSRQSPGWHLAGNALLAGSLLGLFFLRPGTTPPNGLRVTLFDVGQGQAVLLETPDGERFLVDTGGTWKNPSGPFNRTILPQVLRSGKRLDGLFISHSDQDHAGGLKQVLTRLQVGCLYLPMAPDQRLKSFARIAKSHGVPVVYLAAGTQFSGKGWTCQVLGPGPGDRRARLRAPQKISLNELSLVLRWTTTSSSILLPGDIGRIKEIDLAQSDELQADVLVLGHHGSAGSSHPDFLKAVRPRIALVSVGNGNRYGHPADTVLQRLKVQNIRVQPTNQQGTVVLELHSAMEWRTDRSCAGRLDLVTPGN